MADAGMAGAAAPVLLGLGANVGDPLAQLARAIEGLGAFVAGLRTSSIYRTEPVGHRDQPDFYNLVARGATMLAPLELLARILELEREIGRERTFRNAPRVIDIDVLDYAGRVSRDPRLLLPHPGIPSRGFVLHPLAEVAPEWVHPVLGQTARELLSAAHDIERVERLAGETGA
ncbi:MAG TPA: 2-amino-4-hydroxy-6-hydroxymethyldihydropteridine diphosphokinase [Longimicrobium sp.]|nr:2-amino-4-hydroxy-6-hydroxymethyldihydropteridine diphosphokinase [Longimicrobium sp.]